MKAFCAVVILPEDEAADDGDDEDGGVGGDVQDGEVSGK